MSNALFDPGREGFACGEINWATGVVKSMLVRGYTFNAAHKFASDLGATVVATSPALTSKTYPSGVLDAADTAFSAVPTGAACEAVVIVQTSAPAGGADLAASAQRLIVYIDSATGLPVTPNGGDINVAWAETANKIFKL